MSALSPQYTDCVPRLCVGVYVLCYVSCTNDSCASVCVPSSEFDLEKGNYNSQLAIHTHPPPLPLSLSLSSSKRHLAALNYLDFGTLFYSTQTSFILCLTKQVVKKKQLQSFVFFFFTVYYFSLIHSFTGQCYHVSGNTGHKVVTHLGCESFRTHHAHTFTTSGNFASPFHLQVFFFWKMGANQRTQRKPSWTW